MNTELAFKKYFGTAAKYKITIPSRVNLIGEHSDYYESLVLPMAIENLKIEAWIAPRADQKIRLISDHALEQSKVEISTLSDRSKLQWIQYIQGAIAMYAEEYTRRSLRGFDILIKSTIPVGGGLSSSSALTMMSLAALGLANKFTDGNRKYPISSSIKSINEKKNERLLKKLCMMGCWSEYWYGTRGGAMDHFAVTVSKKGQALLLDNRSFDYSYIKVPSDIAIIICNTMVRHNQLYSGFKERKDCAMQGFAKIQSVYPEAKNIRDISIDQLESNKHILTPMEYRRMKHPITERERVLSFVKLINDKNYAELGKIVNRAFNSLKNDYEVSCDELNIMQKAASESDGCFGARITGGGFGGCIVAFVDAKKKKTFMSEVKKKYDNDPLIKKSGIKSDIWEAISGDGLRIEIL